MDIDSDDSDDGKTCVWRNYTQEEADEIVKEAADWFKPLNKDNVEYRDKDNKRKSAQNIL